VAIRYGLRNNVVTNLNASGDGSDQIRNNNAAVLWVVVQVSVITVPTSTATATLKPPTGIIDTSYFAGTGDSAVGAYILLPGDYVEITYDGGPANGQGTATYIYHEVDL